MSKPALRLVPSPQDAGGDQLRSWAQRSCPVKPNAPAGPSQAGGLRFGFYGRVSTEDHQDPAASRAWQLLAHRR